MPLSAVISHQQLAMSYSPQELGFLDLTFSGALKPVVPVLFWSLYFSGNPGLDVPTRAAYSHSASVGRRTVFSFRYRMSRYFALVLRFAGLIRSTTSPFTITSIRLGGTALSARPVRRK